MIYANFRSCAFFSHTLLGLWSLNIIFNCLPGGAEFFPGPARGERGGEEEAEGGHSQSHTAGGGSDWSHPEGPAKGNRAGQVSSGWRGWCRFTSLGCMIITYLLFFYMSPIA